MIGWLQHVVLASGTCERYRSLRCPDMRLHKVAHHSNNTHEVKDANLHQFLLHTCFDLILIAGNPSSRPQDVAHFCSSSEEPA